MHTLEAKIRAANAAGRPALIPFLTAHFPDRAAFWTAFDELDGGADIIGIGVPFSDPVADGPVVEDASRRVLAAGFHLGDLLAELAARRERRAGSAGLVLMGYLNPFLSHGLERLAEEAAAAGVSGCIIPDLPHEEADPARAALGARGIALIPLVGPNTGEERMTLCADGAQGYVYVVSVMGVTGERAALAPRGRNHGPRAPRRAPAAGPGLRTRPPGAACGTAARGPAGRGGVRQRPAAPSGRRGERGGLSAPLAVDVAARGAQDLPRA